MTEGDQMLGELDALKRGLDSPGPARPLSPDKQQAMIEAALAQQHRAPLVRGRRARPAVVLALVAVGAAAALGVLRLASSDAVSEVEAPRSGVPASQKPAVPAPLGSAQAPPSVSAQQAPALQPASPEAAPPSRAAASASEAAKEVDLLKQANDLRRTGDFAGAEKLYRQVMKRYPQTTSAYVAMSSVASLVMARDPAAAVDMYRAARRAHPSGTLDLEIRQGLARAYRKQGRVADERRELQELIARYPAAEASERARARLSELTPASRDPNQ